VHSGRGIENNDGKTAESAPSRNTSATITASQPVHMATKDPQACCGLIAIGFGMMITYAELAQAHGGHSCQKHEERAHEGGCVARGFKCASSSLKCKGIVHHVCRPGLAMHAQGNRVKERFVCQTGSNSGTMPRQHAQRQVGSPKENEMKAGNPSSVLLGRMLAWFAAQVYQTLLHQ
jgi:hypothetical protein